MVTQILLIIGAILCIVFGWLGIEKRLAKQAFEDSLLKWTLKFTFFGSLFLLGVLYIGHIIPGDKIIFFFAEIHWLTVSIISVMLVGSIGGICGILASINELKKKESRSGFVLFILLTVLTGSCIGYTAVLILL